MIRALIAKTQTLAQTLNRIESYMQARRFAHIMSLNPENVVIASHQSALLHAYKNAEICIADGVGITIAARLLSVPAGDRIAGVDLMQEIILAHPDKRIAFVGGYSGVAQKTLRYFQTKTQKPDALWLAIGEHESNDDSVVDTVAAFEPDILFVAFGSPTQELWIETYRGRFPHTICMGVGQAFDVFSHSVSRAPEPIRRIGLEWLYRLITQPWRLKRQLRLLEFLALVLKGRVSGDRSA